MRESFKVDIAYCHSRSAVLCFVYQLLRSAAIQSFMLTPQRDGGMGAKGLFTTEAITFLFRGFAAGPQSSH